MILHVTCIKCCYSNAVQPVLVLTFIDSLQHRVTIDNDERNHFRGNLQLPDYDINVTRT